MIDENLFTDCVVVLFIYHLQNEPAKTNAVTYVYIVHVFAI